MGYYNMPAAKLPPAKPTTVEAAVMAIKSLESLEILGKLIYNCAVAPKEEKYRRVKLTNEKVAKFIVDTPGALDALQSMGWVQSEEEPEFLVVPAGTYFSMREVRVIEDHKDRLRRDTRTVADVAVAASAIATAAAS